MNSVTTQWGLSSPRANGLIGNSIAVFSEKMFKANLVVTHSLHLNYVTIISEDGSLCFDSDHVFGNQMPVVVGQNIDTGNTNNINNNIFK